MNNVPSFNLSVTLIDPARNYFAYRDVSILPTHYCTECPDKNAIPMDLSNMTWISGGNYFCSYANGKDLPYYNHGTLLPYEFNCPVFHPKTFYLPPGWYVNDRADITYYFNGNRLLGHEQNAVNNSIPSRILEQKSLYSSVYRETIKMESIDNGIFRFGVCQLPKEKCNVFEKNMFGKSKIKDMTLTLYPAFANSLPMINNNMEKALQISTQSNSFSDYKIETSKDLAFGKVTHIDPYSLAINLEAPDPKKRKELLGHSTDWFMILDNYYNKGCNNTILIRVSHDPEIFITLLTWFYKYGGHARLPDLLVVMASNINLRNMLAEKADLADIIYFFMDAICNVDCILPSNEILKELLRERSGKNKYFEVAYNKFIEFNP